MSPTGHRRIAVARQVDMTDRLSSTRRVLSVIAAVGIAMTLADAETRHGQRASRKMPAMRATSSSLVWTRRARAAQRAALFEGFNQLRPAVRDSIVALALAQLGSRYIFGGTSPEGGFDCSGLVRYVLSQVDLSLPRTARQQARIGSPVERDQLMPGDLLTFGTADSISHIGIYIGGGKFVHASSVAGRVIVSPLNRPPSPQIKELAGARRLLAAAVLESRGG
jgi:cell wall-associated NlpC family hydrolase